MRLAAVVLPLILASSAVAANHATVMVVADRSMVPVGGQADIALVFTIEPGWHLYWTNPGDTGEPPRADWTLPAGLVAGDLHFPTPHRIDAGGLTAFGYEKSLVLLTKITRRQAGPADATVVVHWMACDAQQCVAESQTVTVSLPAGDGTAIPDERFKTWKAQQPDRPPVGRDRDAVEMTIAADNKRGHLDVAVAAGKTAVDFFPPRFDFLVYDKPQAAGRAMRTPFRVLSDAPQQITGHGILVVKDDATGAVTSEERAIAFRLNESVPKGAK